MGRISNDGYPTNLLKGIQGVLWQAKLWEKIVLYTVSVLLLLVGVLVGLLL